MILTKVLFKKLYDLILLQPLAKSDIIVWLQGDRLDRASKVLRLYNAGWAKKILISGNNILIGSNQRVGENNISLVQMSQWLIKKGVKNSDIIIDDRAMNTYDQAEHIMKLSVKKNWQSIILVGSSYYQPRAFLTFLKQIRIAKWGGTLFNQPVIIGWDKKPAGRNQTSKLIFNEELDKIKKYKKDLIPINQGIKYLNKLK